MTYAIVDIPPSSRGFDTVEALTSSQYDNMYTIGFRYRWLYLGDQVHVDEIAKATASGIGVVPIQHARAFGWMPDAQKGADDGARAVRDAALGQLPPGLPLWADLEGCASTALFADVDAYAKTWCAAVNGSQRPAAVYRGWMVPATPDQWWSLPFTGYGRSFSIQSGVSHRGDHMIQLFSKYPKGECLVSDYCPTAPASIASLLIDIDIAQCDNLGSFPKMLVAV